MRGLSILGYDGNNFAKREGQMKRKGEEYGEESWRICEKIEEQAQERNKMQQCV